MKCEVCGKIGMSGHNVSHSKRRTKTRFLPNIHKVTVPIDGSAKRLKMCTRCLRTMHKLPKPTASQRQ